MRVELKREERGAVAVVTAMLALVLCMTAAFATDLGAAYNSKRQLQTAADAAALAAAQVYARYPGTCDSIRTAHFAEANAAATSYLTKNRPGATTPDITVATCAAAGGRIEVTVSTAGDTPTTFGRLAGVDSITTGRAATARTMVGASSGKLRPYALCSSDVPPAASLPSGVIEITQPGQAHTGSDCSAAEAGGNWWYVACPEDSNGSMSADEVGAALENGCSDNVEIVTPQNSFSSSTLSASLTAHCVKGSPRTPSCLAGDTGNSSNQNKKAYEKWAGLLGKTITLPVFCTASTCTPDTVNGSGSQAAYPVYKIASVVVCGFHIYDNASQSYAGGNCAGNGFNEAYVDAIDKKEVRLFLKFVMVRSAESNIPNDCALGTGCDGGLRTTSLVK